MKIYIYTHYVCTRKSGNKSVWFWASGRARQSHQEGCIVPETQPESFQWLSTRGHPQNPENLDYSFCQRGSANKIDQIAMYKSVEIHGNATPSLLEVQCKRIYMSCHLFEVRLCRSPTSIPRFFGTPGSESTPQGMCRFPVRIKEIEKTSLIWDSIMAST